MGNHQLPPQIQLRDENKMLHKAVLRPSGGNPRHALIDGDGVDMPRVSNPGFVTFVENWTVAVRRNGQISDGLGRGLVTARLKMAINY